MTRNKLILTFAAGLMIGTGALYGDAPKPRDPNPTSTNATSGRPAAPLIVTFDFGKASLQTGKKSEKEFAAIVHELKNYPYAKVEIDGYADAVGTPDFNQKLSEERAQVVRKHLVERYAIAPDRVVVRAYGEERPASDNSTAEGRKENRRVVARIFRLDPGAAGNEKSYL